MVFHPLERAVGYYQHMYTTIEPSGLSWHAGCCASWALWLGKTISCITAGENYPLLPSLGSLYNMFQQYKNQSSGRSLSSQIHSEPLPSQVFFPKCMMSLAIRTTINIWEANTGNSNSLYCLGVSWNPMTNKRRVSHAWDWGFCYNMSMAHGRSFVSPGDITSFKLCICTYAHRFVCVICYLE